MLPVEDSDTYQVIPTSYAIPNGVRMIHIGGFHLFGQSQTNSVDV